MLSIKQGGIKYNFLSLWYDSTRDLTQISRTTGELSNHYTNRSLAYCKTWFNYETAQAWLLWLVGMVWFYGTSTIVGYLLLNPVFTYVYIYIKDIVVGPK